MKQNRAGVVAWPGGARAPPIFGKNRAKHTVGPPQYLAHLISGPPNFKIATPALYYIGPEWRKVAEIG